MVIMINTDIFKWDLATYNSFRFVFYELLSVNQIGAYQLYI